MTYNHKKYMKEYHKKNKDRDRESNKARSRKHYLENKEQIIAKSKEWAKNNPRRRKETEKIRIDNDYKYFIMRKLKRRLVHALQTLTPDKSLSITEYELEWDKIVEGIIRKCGEDRTKVLDHIKPICSFNLYDKEQVRQAFSSENTQLLTRKENQNKIKYDMPQSIYS